MSKAQRFNVLLGDAGYGEVGIMFEDDDNGSYVWAADYIQIEAERDKLLATTQPSPSDEEEARRITNKALSMPNGMALGDMEKEISAALARARTVPAGCVRLADGREVRVLHSSVTYSHGRYETHVKLDYDAQIRVTLGGTTDPNEAARQEGAGG
jgi:hypothetical protein